MNINKLILSALTSVAVLSSAQATVSLTGTALLNAPGLSAGQEYALLVDKAGDGFGALSSVGAGLSIAGSATYGSNYELISSGSASLLGGTFSVLTLNATGINLTAGVDANDSFGVLVFGTSTGTTTAADSFSIWTAANWLLPNDGSTITAPADFDQISTAAPFSGTVVPEPSSFALLAGCFGLAWVMVRRRS
jgi:hypothetical protein